MHLSKKKIRKLLKMKNQSQKQKRFKLNNVPRHVQKSFRKGMRNQNYNLRNLTMRRIKQAGGVRLYTELAEFPDGKVNIADLQKNFDLAITPKIKIEDFNTADKDLIKVCLIDPTSNRDFK